MRKAGVWAAVLLLAATPAHAQFLKGTVRDSETRGPVRSAFVVLLDSTAGVVVGTTVDARGRYTIAVPESGVYAVATSGTGYLTNISSWIAMAATDSFEVNVKLARAVNTLAPVVIEAQRDSLRNVGIPGTMSKIVAGTIAARPLRRRRRHPTTSSRRSTSRRWRSRRCCWRSRRRGNAGSTPGCIVASPTAAPAGASR
ncbi:MAG: carboxypeptidase regulatory-like domain-containing protein [Gemmatimonadetes bacterium]|nr:carboxypeptidase regulatory-like domain-containing protein [Gemmatimonadota bacterium]